MLHPAPGGPCPQAEMTLALYLRQELLSYIPKPLQWQVNTANIKSLVTQELRQMQGYSKQRAQIGFIGRSASRSMYQGPAACDGQGPGGEGWRWEGEEASILHGKVG